MSNPKPGFQTCPECGNLAMNRLPTCPLCGDQPSLQTPPSLDREIQEACDRIYRRYGNDLAAFQQDYFAELRRGPLRKCSCWLGTSATSGNSDERRACAVHGDEHRKSSVQTPPSQGWEQMTLGERVQSYIGNGGLFNPGLMEHDKVRQLIMDLDAAHAAVERQLADLTKELEAPDVVSYYKEQKRAEAAEAQVTALSAQVAELKQVLASALEQHEAMGETLDVQRAAFEERVATLTAQLEAANAAAEKWREQATSASFDADERAALTAQVAELQAQMLKPARTGCDACLEARRAAEAENAQLHGEVARLTQEKNEAGDETGYRSVTVNLRAEIDTLRGTRNEQRERIANLEATLQQLRQANKHLKELLTETLNFVLIAENEMCHLGTVVDGGTTPCPDDCPECCRERLLAALRQPLTEQGPT